MWLQTRQRTSRIALGLRFGVNLRELHQCPCCKLVDARDTHGLSCKRGAARAIRHHQLNDIVRRTFMRANITSVLEPTGLSKGDGKRSDDMTLIPWQGGENVTWDVTVSDTIYDSYLHSSLGDVCGQRGERGGQQKGDQVRSSWPLVHLNPVRFRNLRINQQ